jgi:protein-L-isoaspartate(D-aspartate) O-methyltransferase
MIADTDTETPAQLRTAMVAKLREEGYISTPEVAAVFARVPREHYAPGAALVNAYNVHDTVVTRRGENGRATSSISAPWLQARMIEDAQIKPGDRILEVGSGGCNAAYLSEMTGPAGSVVTLDIDPWVTERAARFLGEAGYHNVEVVTGDADHAANNLGQFDVVLVTVGVYDAPWARLLREGGRMVVPIMVASSTRSVTFVRRGDQWDGGEPVVCGFVPLQGAGTGYDQDAWIGGRTVHLTTEGGPILDQAALDMALSGERTETWTGITSADLAGFFDINLHLAITDARAGLIRREPDTDLIVPAANWFTPSLITPDSFAYLTIRSASGNPEERLREFGVHAHGPKAAGLAADLVDHVRQWEQRRRAGTGPAFTLYLADADITAPACGKIFTRKHVQIVVEWP